MNKIKQLILSGAFVLTLASFVSLGNVAEAHAAPPRTPANGCVGGGGILTFPCWYRGLPISGGQPGITKLEDLWIIGLNIVEILIQIAAYVAVGYIIWGGFKYIKSQGDPGKLAEAKGAVLHAVIGFGIALASVGIVNLIAGGIR